MNYRSMQDLHRCLVSESWRIPRDVDVIVGLPRSGLLAANLLALHMNLPLTDLQGLVEGRLLGHGHRLRRPLPNLHDVDCHALVLDDSIASGRAMRQARQTLQQAGIPTRLTFAAVYGDEERSSAVDLVLATCPHPRIFAWNLMHSGQISNSCVDIDGVLCRDPTDDENDDGPRYERFIREAEPFQLPTWPVGCLVTCRLEKYRRQTEEWLVRHGVIYNELIMLDLPTKAARQAWGRYGEFKGAIYRARPHSLFIESSQSQTLTIADIANKPVFCVETEQIVHPTAIAMVRSGVNRIQSAVRRRARFATTRLGHRLQAFGSGWWQHTAAAASTTPPPSVVSDFREAA